MKTNKKSKTFRRSIILIIIAIGIFSILARSNEDTWIKDESGNWIKHGNPSAPAPVANFQECSKIYPVAQIYPEKCTTPDGKEFLKPYL